jgi:hypothetical protein
MKNLIVSGFPTVKFVKQSCFLRVLSNLTKSQVLVDRDFYENVDMFYLKFFEELIDWFQLNFDSISSSKVKYDINLMEFDKEKFQYSIDGNLCVTSGNVMTQYFRDFLMFHQAEEGLLIIDDDTSKMSHLIEKFPNHRFIDQTFEENDGLGSDYIAERMQSGLDGAINKCIVELIFNTDYDVNRIMSMDKSTYYDNSYFYVVEEMSIQQIKPELLFTELIKYGNDSDIHYGLTRLGFIKL